MADRESNVILFITFADLVISVLVSIMIHIAACGSHDTHDIIGIGNASLPYAMSHDMCCIERVNIRNVIISALYCNIVL